VYQCHSHSHGVRYGDPTWVVLQIWRTNLAEDISMSRIGYLALIVALTTLDVIARRKPIRCSELVNSYCTMDAAGVWPQEPNY